MPPKVGPAFGGVSLYLNAELYFADSNALIPEINGYDKVFWKYVNRKISILYSPKYDQVMFLKD